MDVSEAIKTATEYLGSVYPDAGNLRIEEVEITDDDNYWLVTISFYETHDYSIKNFSNPRVRKQEFKIFKIDTKTKEVRSMKIRDFA